MDETRQFMHNVFWHEDEVAIHFQLGAVTSAPSSSQGAGDRLITKGDAIARLNLNDLNSFLTANGYKLSSFTVQDTLRPANPHVEQGAPQQNSPRSEGDLVLESVVGKYLFRSLDKDGNVVPTVVGFFHFAPINDTRPPMDRRPFLIMSMSNTSMSNTSMSNMPMPGMSKSSDEGHGDGNDHGKGNGDDGTKSLVPHVVNLINENLSKLRQGGEGRKPIPIVAAAPVWLGGSTQNPDGPRPQGCPAIPPIPVEGDDYSASSPGLWPISLPEIPHDLRGMTGDGVTAFILDTLPRHGDITRALEAAEDNNLLLLDVANNATFQYNLLPDILDHAGPFQPSTGKDIYGRLIGGFRMQDHGLFVAGIVRDLAPSATVECIRVLSDYGVGDLPTVTKALEGIQERMSPVDPNTLQVGDLYQKPVVINMSLVISPVSYQQAADMGFDPNLVLSPLKAVIKSLVNLGAIIVASAGNEADIRQGSQAMNPQQTRPGALFPAAFANAPDLIPDVIPVGAVDRYGNAASYSCFPGPKGIGTYGGEVPLPVKPLPPDCMTGATNLDAVIGIYSALDYPALSLDDCEARYHTPNANGWAYWVGTSFATPIISAVTARILEAKLRGVLAASLPVPDAIANAASSHQVTWDRLDPSNASTNGPLIRAVQALNEE
jgi:Subtilase family